MQKKFTDFKVGNLVKRISLNEWLNKVEIGLIVEIDRHRTLKVFWREDKTYTYFASYVAEQTLEIIE